MNGKIMNREKRLAYIKKEGLHPQDALTVENIATAVFVITDFFVSFSMWDQLQTTDMRFVALTVFGVAVGLDVPMYIVGKTIVEYLAGKKKKSITVITSLALTGTFLLAFALNLNFSYVNRGIFELSDGAEGNLTNNIAVTEQVSADDADTAKTDEAADEEADIDDPIIINAAIFKGCIVFFTSMCSLFFTLHWYNPDRKDELRERRKKARILKAKLHAQQELSTIRRGIEESKLLADREKLLVARTNDIYRCFVSDVNNEEITARIAFNSALAEKLSPNGKNHIIDESIRIIKENPPEETFPTQTLECITEFVEKIFHEEPSQTNSDEDRLDDGGCADEEDVIIPEELEDVCDEVDDIPEELDDTSDEASDAFAAFDGTSDENNRRRFYGTLTMEEVNKFLPV